jgi:hypothetical protein
MTKIKNYPLDLEVNGGDKWIGTDSQSLAKLTKNFTPDNLAKYYNDKEVVESVNQLRFFYDTVDPGDDRASGSFSFQTEVGPTVPFSSITNIVFSKYTMGNDAVNNFMTDIVNSIIIIQKADNPNIYAFYALNSYEIDPLDGDFYNVVLTYSSGAGSIEEDQDYFVSLIQFAGAAGIQTILGSEFIDSSLTGIGEVTLSLSATGDSTSLTGLRGDNTWGTLGLEALDEGGRNSFGNISPPIGRRLVGRDPANFGPIGQDSIDFSSGYYADVTTLPFGGSITMSPQIGSSGPGTITIGNTNENNTFGGTIFGPQNVNNGGPNIEPTYAVGTLINGSLNQNYGLNYYNLISGYKNLIGDRNLASWSAAGFPYPYPVQYWSGQIGMYNQMPSGFSSVQLGYGLLSGGPFCTTVGIGNEDVTLSIASNLSSSRNNLNPRFVVGVGTSTGETANPGVGTRANGFVVMSDGTATFPELSNALIDSAGVDSAVTKGWVEAQGTGTPTGLEAIDEGNGTGWRLIGRDPANYGNIGLNATDLSISNSASSTKGSIGTGSLTLGLNNENPLDYSIVSGINTTITVTNPYHNGNFITGESNTIYNNMYNNIIGGFRNTIGTNGATLEQAIVYDSIAVGDNLNMYAARNSGMIGQALSGGSVGATIVGVANVDLTTSIANAFTANFNNYGPRFIVGTGIWNPQNNTGTRANGFVVMSDGTATFPVLSNIQIDSAGADSAVTKGWVQAQTDINTTYDLASSQSGADVDLTLTGSDASVDTLKLVSGANVTITDDGSNNITIASSGIVPGAESIQIEVKNTSGGTLLKGTPVYITGTVGASVRAEISAADSSMPSTMPAIGLLAQDLLNNADGFAITGGFLSNITTDPIDGLTPTPNNTIYVKPGGGLTLTKPVEPNLIQNIAKVGKVSGGNAGSVIVSSILRTNDVPNLPLGRLFVGTSANTSLTSDVVYIDDANSRVGIGTSSPANKLDILDNIAGSGGINIANTNTGSSSYSTIAINNGTAGRGGALNYIHPTYTAFPVLTNYLDLVSYSQTSGFIIRTSGTGNIKFLQGGITAANERFTINTNDVIVNTGLSNVDFRVKGLSGDVLFVDASAGNVGIGTTSPDYKLDVAGDVRIESTSALNFGGTAAASSTWQLQTANAEADFQIGETNTGPRMYFESGGAVGIGNTAPAQKLHVSGNIRVGTTADNVFSNKFTALGNVDVELSSNAGHNLLLNSTSGDNVGVGTPTPQAKLDVAGGIKMSDDASAAASTNVGTLRYRADANNSYVDMCMQTGASTYVWVNIVQNNW